MQQGYESKYISRLMTQLRIEDTIKKSFLVLILFVGIAGLFISNDNNLTGFVVESVDTIEGSVSDESPVTVTFENLSIEQHDILIKAQNTVG